MLELRTHSALCWMWKREGLSPAGLGALGKPRLPLKPPFLGPWKGPGGNTPSHCWREGAVRRPGVPQLSACTQSPAAGVLSASHATAWAELLWGCRLLLTHWAWGTDVNLQHSNNFEVTMKQHSHLLGWCNLKIVRKGNNKRQKLSVQKN